MTDTTHALMHGKLNSVNDIIDAVEQEQDHDERFHSCRVLIREVKRLQKSSKEALTNYNELKILVKEVGEGITFCMYCDLPYSDAEGRDCDCCPFCQAYDPDDFDFREDACSDCHEEAAAGHPSLSAWERNQ